MTKDDKFATNGAQFSTNDFEKVCDKDGFGYCMYRGVEEADYWSPIHVTKSTLDEDKCKEVLKDRNYKKFPSELFYLFCITTNTIYRGSVFVRTLRQDEKQRAMGCHYSITESSHDQRNCRI